MASEVRFSAKHWSFSDKQACFSPRLCQISQKKGRFVVKQPSSLAKDAHFPAIKRVAMTTQLRR
jgi:predicted component of type VI protein secretion system